jgi:hypothetical protein
VFRGGDQDLDDLIERRAVRQRGDRRDAGRAFFDGVQDVRPNAIAWLQFGDNLLVGDGLPSREFRLAALDASANEVSVSGRLEPLQPGVAHADEVVGVVLKRLRSASSRSGNAAAIRNSDRSRSRRRS